MSLSADQIKNSFITTTGVYMPFTVDTKYNNTIKYDYCGNTIKINADWDITEIKGLNKYIANQWDDIKEKIEDAEARKQHDKLVARQKINRNLRAKVKYVHWSGNTCITYWNDGTQTKARWDSNEPFDPEKAILVCMARKLYLDTNIYNEVLRKYEEDGWQHYEKTVLKDDEVGDYIGGTD